VPYAPRDTGGSVSYVRTSRIQVDPSDRSGRHSVAPKVMVNIGRRGPRWARPLPIRTLDVSASCPAEVGSEFEAVIEEGVAAASAAALPDAATADGEHAPANVVPEPAEPRRCSQAHGRCA